MDVYPEYINNMPSDLDLLVNMEQWPFLLRLAPISTMIGSQYCKSNLWLTKYTSKTTNSPIVTFVSPAAVKCVRVCSFPYFASSILWSTSSSDELWATWRVPNTELLFFFIFSAWDSKTREDISQYYLDWNNIKQRGDVLQARPQDMKDSLNWWNKQSVILVQPHLEVLMWICS